MEFANAYQNLFVNEYRHTLVYTLIAFFLPFLLGHPQWIVGIVVNAMLILGATNVKGVKLLPIIVAPALGALTRGLIFGPFTIYLVYMIPFIWVGNAILVYTFKKLAYVPAAAVGAVAKSLFLFLAAFTLFKLGIIPVVFVTAMGIIQLATAIGGSVLAYGAKRVI